MRQLKLIIAALFLISPFTATADLIEYDLAWDGIDGSGATAIGMVTLDTDLLPNPGNNRVASAPAISNFMITVSGTVGGTGDGTWTQADFFQIFFLTGFGGLALDLTADLFGQDTGGNPWGTAFDGSGGDFNFFSTLAGAPSGINYFTFGTLGGDGELLRLTSMRPKSVPEPGTLALLSLGLLGLGLSRRRKA